MDRSVLVGLFYIFLAVFATGGVCVPLLRLKSTSTLETLLVLALCAILGAGAALFFYLGVTAVSTRDGA